ncbi:SDR family NAD(P)-dependent oxidoreductase [Streptomyces sp. NBC_01604]|uniref:SDR family NAD(P)-dependent oxidoreductase n=1 Tax=Streptomyces sp. NBC_01604 TaxID=2975894 RepID=UPI003865DD84
MLSAHGPWSGPKTSPPGSLKRPVPRTSTDRVRTRSQVTYLVGDVTDLGDMTPAVETVVRGAGRLDIVIANAGVLGRGVTLRASSTSVVDRLFDVNVEGALNTVRAALPGLIENRGRLVLISSVFAFVNGAGAISYAMSKAAVEQLGRGLRVELAAHGVSVTTAYFAVINTDMTRQGLDEDPVAQALVGTQPRFLRKRISPEQARRPSSRACVAGMCRCFVRADGLWSRRSAASSHPGWTPAWRGIAPSRASSDASTRVRARTS